MPANPRITVANVSPTAAKRQNHQKSPRQKFQKNEDLQYKIPHLMKQITKRKPISERNERLYNSLPKDGTGHGIYTYENKYFKYEGQWRNGKKHGQGKLSMLDGSYYEGSFTNGEINGQGFRYFSTTGCKYTGQFENGELHGQGKMIYADGSIYDGQWYRNRKHGYGVMRTLNNAIYEGVYQGNRRHGEGDMLYSNGDKYSGHWLNDHREGSGRLVYKDGTVYQGGFKKDVFHGLGRLMHCSGYSYEGEWFEGQPVRLATKIVIVIEENPYTIRQGTPFTIHVECQDDNGEVVHENGRELQLLAGFKYYPPKEGSVLFDMIEDVEDKPIDTPFGYQVVPYPITDELKTEDTDGGGMDDEEKEEEQSLSKSGTALDLGQEPPDEQGDEREDEEEKEKGDDGEQKDNEGDESKIDDDDKASTADTEKDGDSPDVQTNEKEGQTTEDGQIEGQGDEKDGSSPEKQETVEVESVPLPPSVANHRNESGVCEWENLQLSPAPPMYRPFVAMEEAANDKLKKSKAKLKPGGIGLLSGRTGSSRSVASGDSTPGFASPATTMRTLGNSSRTSNNSTPGFASPATTMLDKFRKKKEKAREEIYARLGEYVLMVHDVTTPPAFGRTLEPAFLLLKLKSPKREKIKKQQGPKWDTQKHIAQAMVRSEENA